MIQGYNSTAPSINQIQVWIGDYTYLIGTKQIAMDYLSWSENLMGAGVLVGIEQKNLATTSIGQVIIAELNGDMYPDLFGVAEGNPTARTVWYAANSGTGWNKYVLCGLKINISSSPRACFQGQH